MGQARLRGTYEERAAQAEHARKRAAAQHLLKRQLAWHRATPEERTAAIEHQVAVWEGRVPGHLPAPEPDHVED